MALITEAWPLEGDLYALYTQNQEVVKLAQRYGLKLMADYYDARTGKLLAMQFVGSKEIVESLIEQKVGEMPLLANPDIDFEFSTGIRKPVARKVACAGCGSVFQATSNRQKYCSRCKKIAYAEAHRKAVRKYYRKVKTDKLERL
ncbi:hypothetical protein [Thermanaeromonas sp. C210]|uniref:hypothetical protein n=1 Tax=Thermanaeromonas sp. C210 TaxID=2731925 RepID=UPI00155BB909|nr:hypothetical protein [Thermanaeromonas sp. C210]GFN24287.1 hypothetical protein TAMC210_26050 [Thermanaeromonas sp. C210]